MYYFWIFLGSFCDHFGIILESLWDCFRTVFEYFHFFWKFWEWSGNNFGILSDCFWIYPAYSRPIFRQNFKILFFLYISLYIPIYIYIYIPMGSVAWAPALLINCCAAGGPYLWPLGRWRDFGILAPKRFTFPSRILHGILLYTSWGF